MSESNKPFPMPHWPQHSRTINLSKSESVYVKYPKTVFKFDYSGAPFQGKFIGEDRHKNFELYCPFLLARRSQRFSLMA